MNRRGGIIIWVVTVAVIVGILILTVPQVFITRRQLALDERQVFEAHLLALDAIEITKFLILYEKVFYRRSPLALRASGRAACIHQLWGQGFGEASPGSADMLNACGSYGINGAYIGTNRISCGPAPIIPGGRDAFCPGFVRSATLSGNMLERLLFERWVDNGIMVRNQPGVYSVELDLTDAFNPSEQNSLSVRLFGGQRLIEDSFGLLARLGLQVRARVDFLTDSANFQPVASERYIKITGIAEFTGGRGVKHVVERSESMMVALSTPKDFALFIVYPETSAGVQTQKFSEALQLAPSVRVIGRAYFNGDIDVPLERLPVFSEAVAISGTIRINGQVPGPSSIGLLQEKFPKGFITNFSAPRYILDGRCAPVGAASTASFSNNLKIVNGTRMNCFDENTPNKERFSIRHYIERLGNMCSSKPITVKSTGYTQPQAMIELGCETVVNWDEASFLTGGFLDVTAQDPGYFAGILSPVQRLLVGGTTNVYGVVLGGYVRAGGSTKFYSVGMLQPGLPGIGSDATLGSLNSSALSANDGIAVPIVNVPFVLSTGGEAG